MKLNDLWAWRILAGSLLLMLMGVSLIVLCIAVLKIPINLRTGNVAALLIFQFIPVLAWYLGRDNDKRI